MTYPLYFLGPIEIIIKNSHLDDMSSLLLEDDISISQLNVDHGIEQFVSRPCHLYQKD